MDRDAILAIMNDWLSAAAEADPTLGWVRNATLRAEPAFLVDDTTKDGDEYKAGAVSIVLETSQRPGATAIQRLDTAIVGDVSLGRRAKRAWFESSSDGREIGRIVVIPS